MGRSVGERFDLPEVQLDLCCVFCMCGCHRNLVMTTNLRSLRKTWRRLA